MPGQERSAMTQVPRDTPPPTRRPAARADSSVDLYHALAEAIPALVLTTSSNGELQYCNAQLLTYLGTDVKGLQGARWVEYIHPDDVRSGRERWERRIRELRPFSVEYRIRRRDGMYRWHLTHTAPLRRPDGAIHAWIAVSVDVHDRRESEQQVRRFAEELSRASEAKDEFLGLVSHELRTPITTIYGNAQILRRKAGQLEPDVLEQALSDIEREAIRLQQLIDNMFVLARLEDGGQLEGEPLLLGRIVTRVVGEHRQRHPRRHVDIEDEAGTAPVRGTPIYVEQILRNLLSNAEKYSPPAEPITVVVSRSDAHVAVRVLDRGIGLGAGEEANVFKAFYRTGTAAARASGAGLGLSVARRLMDDQGGELWIRPREGGGSEAAFTLPLVPEEDES